MDWPKYNHEPWDTIKVNWGKTYALRKVDLESKKIGFDDLLKNLPRYNKPSGYELLEIDFQYTYPNTTNNFKHLWPGYINRVTQLAFEEARSNRDKHVMETFKIKEGDDDQNIDGFIALNVIFYLLPKSNKSVRQSLDRLFRSSPKCTLI